MMADSVYQEEFNRDFKRLYDWPPLENVLTKWMDHVMEVADAVEAILSAHDAGVE